MSTPPSNVQVYNHQRTIHCQKKVSQNRFHQKMSVYLVVNYFSLLMIEEEEKKRNDLN
jgi:hypothetical protein